MKIIIVPHTHWDREWYFTSETSQELLNFNLDNCLNYKYPITKFYLDGQVSLVDDYLKHANDVNKQKFIDFVRQKKLIVGPLYSQPDVFNSLGETTIRNIEIAQTLLKQWTMPSTRTFYCPDTFGFGDNLPQIVNLFGFKDFVFWRGTKKQPHDIDTFIWKGVEGSCLNCYRLKFGYWTLGSMFSWGTLTDTNIKETATSFLKSFEDSNIYTHFKQQAILQNGVVMFPFGGDQAPIHPLTNAFFAAVNEISQDEWVLGEFEDFFKTQTPTKIVTGVLDYGFDSKIHRTITSTRYDFKKLFRENEISLYHQLEPLELFYKHCDSKYVINNDDIIKQLCLMQAHDVLGGCVTDNVYLASYQKLLDIKERIETKQAMLLKQLGLQMNLDNQQLLIFNSHVSKEGNNICFKTVYTTNQLSGYYDCREYSIYVLDSKEYTDVDNSYISNLLIINKAMQPLNLCTINYSNLKPVTVKTKILSDDSFMFNWDVSYDQGDLFDADEVSDKKPTVKDTHIKSQILQYPGVELTVINGELVIDGIKNPYKLTDVKLSEDHHIHLEIENHCDDIIVKLQSKKEFTNLKYLQHLAVQNYVPRTVENWKSQGYRDDPINVDKNSGLIFDESHYICTRGTNEFTFRDNKVSITLYRSTGLLGKPNLNSRPGVASGLTDHRIYTPLGQLHKALSFDFKYGINKGDVDNNLNSFYKTPLVFQVGSKDLIASKMERFVFLKQSFKVEPLNLDLPLGFISSLRIDNDSNCLATVVNFKHERLSYQNQKIGYNQIKRIQIKNDKK